MKKTVFIAAVCLLGLLKMYSQQDINSRMSKTNEFAFELMTETYTDNDNSLLSPFSISVALAMTYEGARGSTAREMRNTLNFERKRKNHHNEFIKVLNHFNSINKNVITTANALMAQEDYGFLDKYFELMQEYGANVQYANFRDDLQREAARKALNNWVMSKTNDKIENLIKQDHLDHLTRLVLVNAIHFKANWQISFPENRTRQMVFYGKERQVIVDFMHGRDYHNYAEDSICQILELSYQDSIASMIIFLPKENTELKYFVNNVLSNDYLCNTIKQLENKQVNVIMPKFSYESEYELKEPLKSLGMIDAFSHKANFRGISGNKLLMIDEVVHKTFIELDETGTEAAAATAVIIREKSAPADKPVFFNANRPFFYLIRENSTGSILFMGSIVKL